MDIETLFDSELDEHAAVVQAVREQLRAPFLRLCAVAQSALTAGNKLVLFGNGGSAADAQHLAAELVVRYKADRAPLAAVALTTDSSILTAAANDFGYDQVFELQLRALGRAGDMAIGLTTSGNSPNVINALTAAREMGMVAAALTGEDGGRLNGLAEPLLKVPSATTARIQEMHITIGHMLCDVLEQSCAN